MTTLVELEDRRNQVRRLKILGWTDRKIADKFGVTRRTIQNDITAIQDENKDRYLLKDPTEEVLMNRLETLHAMNELRMKLYHDTNTDSVKLGCLNAIERSWETMIRDLQTLGLVNKEADRLEVDGIQDLVVNFVTLQKKVRAEKEIEHDEE